MNQILTLYTGPNCHLCDQAKGLIYPVLQGTNWTLQEVDISNNEDLKERYGTRIPVMAVFDGEEGGREKGWPFTPGQVKQLIMAT